MNRRVTWVATLTLLLCWGQRAQSGIIYSQDLSGSPPGSLQSQTVSGGQQQVIADDFTLTAPATVTGISWFGFPTDSSQQQHFEITIFGNSSAPSVGPALGQVQFDGFFDLTGMADNSTPGLVSYQVSLPLAGVPLDATTYWLSIVSLNDPNWSWAMTTITDGNYALRVPGESDTFAVFSPGDLAFTLFGDSGTTAVPEPASLAMLGLGAVGLIGYTWRRRRRTAAAG